MPKHSHYKKIKAQKRLEKEAGGPTKACESCEKQFPVKKLVYGPDPFAAEINGDYTPVWQCKECVYESHMDI